VSFAWPQALALLAVLPIAVWAWITADRRRRREAGAFGNPALLPGLVHAKPGRRRWVPPLILLAAFALLVFGLARPHAKLPVKREEATVVLAIDTSRSMQANDVQPTRMVAARKAATEFIERLPDKYRLAIVSFSTKAEVVLPPTIDRDAARAALAQLRLGSGTAIGDAIARAMTLVAQPVQPAQPGGPQRGGQRPDVVPASILLLSDGAQTVGGVQPQQAAQRARRLGVPITTIALGTRDARVRVPLPRGLYQLVSVPPDPQSLRRIAQTAGGRFYQAPNAEQLDDVYRELGSRLGSERRRVEVTSYAAGAAALLLLAGAGLSSLWFRRAF
jgi:Ca-activated chloride channel family protein